ncbi:ketopantoate reductase family protein [Paenibacillus aquistagni]|uniref:ketopantoate reductase family protein n=1 Tax=Paenibacillus aquistagni TaxID=1852522 RepID=UPI000B50A939|nr:2-dehydropantoate 2-reductase [Paenibacillus aquistagni]
MRIDIVGAGSIGLLLAAVLRKSGQEVRVWTRTKEQAVRISSSGIKLHELDEQAYRIDGVEALPLDEAPDILRTRQERLECLFLVVKQTHIDQRLIDMLGRMPLAANGVVVCFQNGVGHMEKLARAVPAEALLRAVTTEAAKRTSSHEVWHTGTGSIMIEDSDELTPERKLQLIKLDKQLNDAGFSSFLSNHIQDIIYRKLLVNAVINPLTALLRIPNGLLLEGQERQDLMRAVYEEVAMIYAREGIHLNEDDWQHLINVCQQTAMNTSSMLADVQAGRKTEIDAITGAIIRMAEQHQIDVPLQRVLYQLIQAVQSA